MLWLLSKDPLQIWLSNDENTLADKLSLQQIYLIESRIAKPATVLAGLSSSRGAVRRRNVFSLLCDGQISMKGFKWIYIQNLIYMFIQVQVGKPKQVIKN